MARIQSFDVSFPHEMVHLWIWILVFGIGMLALGVIAIARSMAATVASMLDLAFYGAALIALGLGLRAA